MSTTGAARPATVAPRDAVVEISGYQGRCMALIASVVEALDPADTW